MKKLSALFPALLLLAACSATGAENPIQPSLKATTAESASPSATVIDDVASVTCEYYEAGTAARPVEFPPTENVKAEGVTIATLTLNGDPLQIQLLNGLAPCTANSFESLAKQGYFDDTDCHRLTTENGLYVLQCGDPSGTGGGGPGYNFADELLGSETYPAGTIAMANAGPNTNGSQFFIVYEETSLPASYTVFGELDDAGLAVIREIAQGGHDGSSGSAGGGAPLLPAHIDSVTIDS